MTNKVLVTGSSSGIGQEIANYLEGLGYDVLRTGRRPVNAQNYFQADLADYAQLTALAGHAKGVNILINNAGEYANCPIEKMGHAEIEGMVKLNLTAPYILSALLVPDMKKSNWGRIINIGSISGVVGEGNASLYSATKAGLIGLTKALALELAQNGITVNTINPGWVETDMAAECDYLDAIPQKRFIEPIEVAKMVEYLISDGAKGVTGQSISLCAGLSVG